MLIQNGEDPRCETGTPHDVRAKVRAGPLNNIQTKMANQQPTEKPAYVLPQMKKRLLVPKIITFLFLGVIFYMGVLLNVALLNLSGNTETLVSLVALIVLILIIVFGIFYNLIKAKKQYLFYNNRIVFWKKQIPLNTILNVDIKRNFLDKMFKTYSLQLTKKFAIENIPNNVQLNDYVQKLVNYSKNAPAPS
tara:strand:+ start:1222 stop:1797 length:576 start_codon:yes stop_codon:yes gene_type:complete